MGTGSGSGESGSAQSSVQNSGGQPLSISCSVQFVFIPHTLKKVYLAFNSYAGARTRYLLLSSNTISFTVQQFTPHNFWEDRKKVSDMMLEKLNKTLWEDGYVHATNFQILNIVFPARYENMITAVQVAEQSKVVREYKQRVQRVVQSIEIMRYMNLATIANISAAAIARSKRIQARAARTAFNLKQSTKATEYEKLQHELGFNFQHLTQYLKVKAISTHTHTGPVVLGFPQMEHETTHRR